jgi:cytochrome c biogenesis protein CcdA
MLLFVLGFAAAFTALGAFTATFQPLLRSPTGLRVSGGVVLAFGVLMLLYALRIGGAWLYAERRPFLDRLRPGTGAALPLGMAFAAGWTPCIGPVLAGVLGLAAAQGGSEIGGSGWCGDARMERSSTRVRPRKECTWRYDVA